MRTGAGQKGRCGNDQNDRNNDPHGRAAKKALEVHDDPGHEDPSPFL
jgi:hypothetical protein